jgi:serine/threonine-protein kinase
MASVYEAVNPRLDKRVAIKVLHAHLDVDPDGRARFLREGRAAARLRHPHVVDVFELEEHQGRAFLVMELLDGEDLATLLAREKRLEEAAALDILLPVLSAIAAAHDAGVIHRDIKPSNVFLAQEPGGRVRPKVVDFGVSKVAGAKPLTAADVMVGTVPYMAPEQIRAARDVGAATDQYSLAVVLYECLTGKRPFDGDSPVSIIAAILHDPLVPPSKVVRSIPRALDDVLQRALSREPENRFPHVREFARCLLPFSGPESAARWRQELGGGTSTASALARSLPAPPAKRRAPAVAAAIVVVLASAALMASLLRPTEHAQRLAVGASGVARVLHELRAP